MRNRPDHPSKRISRTRGYLGGAARRRTKANRDGFALIAVIWTLGLITLLSIALIVGARYRTRIASNYASSVLAETAAESAINLGIATALGSTNLHRSRFPLRCVMPGGEKVFIAVEKESGKVDLNTASPASLHRVFAGLTQNLSLGAQIADRILQQRKSVPKPSTDSAGNQPSKARFVTIMQLDQIDGVSPQFFRVAAPFMTVRSGRTEPDADAASLALRQLLQLDQKPLPPTSPGLPITGTITIRADVTAADGARFIREALVSLTEGGRPYIIREWRRGDIKPTSPMLRTIDATGPACLRTARIALIQ